MKDVLLCSLSAESRRGGLDNIRCTALSEKAFRVAYSLLATETQLAGPIT
jgi:hypothetical protein